MADDQPDRRISLEQTLPGEAPRGGSNRGGAVTPEGPLGSFSARLEPPRLDQDRFLIEGEIARGGMGRILRAVDRYLGRTVAIKELLEQRPELRERFAREALIGARLQHPSIIPVYEAGAWADGRPALTMKLVDGEPFDRAIGRCAVFDERLALLTRLLPAIDAVAYAHAQGVVHRDLKPANILLGPFGETLVIDWGVAKIIAAADASGGDDDTGGQAEIDAALTSAGAVVGTPFYMAPEQASGDEVGPPADVYALGAVLAELLALRERPPGAESETKKNVINDDQHGDAERPTAAAATSCPAALTAIVDKALAPAPTDRYTAAELAEELRRYATGRLVSAHAYTHRELLWRWLRRHRAAAVVTVISVLIIAGLAAFSARRIIGERDAAETARRQASARADELSVQQAFAESRFNPRAAIALLADLSVDSALWSEAHLIATDIRDRGIARELRGHPGQVIEMAFASPTLLLTVEADRATRWDLDAGVGEVIDRGAGAHAISPDGAFFSRARGAGLDLVDVVRGSTVRVSLPAAPSIIAVAPGGAEVAASGRFGVVRVGLDAAVETLSATESAVLAYSPSGALLVAEHDSTTAGKKVRGIAVFRRGVDGLAVFIAREATPSSVTLYDDDQHVSFLAAKTPLLYTYRLDAPAEPIAYSHEPEPIIMAPSGRGRGLIVGKKGEVLLIESETITLARTDLPVTAVAALAGAGGAIAGSVDGSVVYWERGTVFYRNYHHPAQLEAIAAAPDGERIATASADQTIRIYERPITSHYVLEPAASAAAIATSGRFVAALDAAGLLRVWKTASEVASAPLSEVPMVSVVAGDSWLASVSLEGRLHLFDEHGVALPGVDVDVDGAVTAIAAASDWLAVAVGSDVWRIDIASGARRPLGHMEAPVARLAAAGQAWMAATTAGQLVVSGERLAKHDGAIGSIAVSRDGVAAVAGAGADIDLWQRGTAVPNTLDGLADAPSALAFTRGGRLVSGDRSGTTALWDVAFERRFAREEHEGPILAVGYDESKARLISVGSSSVRVVKDDIPSQAAALRAWIAAVLERDIVLSAH